MYQINLFLYQIFVPKVYFCTKKIYFCTKKFIFVPKKFIFVPKKFIFVPKKFILVPKKFIFVPKSLFLYQKFYWWKLAFFVFKKTSSCHFAQGCMFTRWWMLRLVGASALRAEPPTSLSIHNLVNTHPWRGLKLHVPVQSDMSN